MSNKENQIVTFSKDIVPSTAERFIATVAKKGGKVEAEQHVITMTDGENQASIEINSITAQGKDLERTYLEQIASELRQQFDIDVEFKINDKYGDFESDSAFQTINAKFNPTASASEDNSESTEAFVTKVKQALEEMQQKGIVENTDLKIEYNSQRISNTHTTLQLEHYSSNQDPKLTAPTELQQDEEANNQDLTIATPYNAQNQVMQMFAKPRTEDLVLFDDSLTEFIEYIEFFGVGPFFSRSQSSTILRGKKEEHFAGFCIQNNIPLCSINNQIEQVMPTLEDYKSAVLPYYTCKPLSLGAVKKVPHSDHPISQGDLILTRVYSDSHLDAEDLFPYYVNDLSHNGDATSRDVMNMISIWIAQGKIFPQKENTIYINKGHKKIDVEITVKNPIKFIYNLEHTNCADLNDIGRNFLAYYDFVHNIVFTKSGMQKLLLAHELTHAAMDHLFDNEAKPYPRSSDDASVAGYRTAIKESLVKVWNRLNIPNSNPELMTPKEMITQLLPKHPQSLLLKLALLRTQGSSVEGVVLSRKHLSELEEILQQCLDCTSNDNNNDNDNFSMANLFKLFSKPSSKSSYDNCFSYNELAKLASTEGSEIKEAVDSFLEKQGLSIDDLKVITVLARLNRYFTEEFDSEFIVLVPELHAQGVSDEVIEYYFASALKFWQENISPAAQSMIEAHKAHCEKFFYDVEAEQCKNLNAFDMLAMSNSNFAYCIAEIGHPEENFA